MSIEVHVNGDQAIVRLPAISDLLVATDLRRHLVEQIREHRRVVIDAAAIEKIATPCIQVLIVADKTMSHVERTLAIANPSAQTRAGFADLGLADFLEARLSHDA